MGSETTPDFAAADAETSAILALASREVDLGIRAPLSLREAVCIARAYKTLRPTPTPAADDALFKLRRAINGLRVSEATSTDEVAWADEIEGRLDAYLARRARPLPDDVRAVVELLRELVAGEDACRYDHHGYCQSHRLDPKPCPVERATALLAHLQRTEG